MKFALRQLLKNPGFSVVVVLTLALGIGSSSAVFSLVQGVLLTPPPYPHPERMVLVLLVITLAACWIPALRATRIEPISALRSE